MATRVILFVWHKFVIFPTFIISVFVPHQRSFGQEMFANLLLDNLVIEFELTKAFLHFCLFSNQWFWWRITFVKICYLNPTWESIGPWPISIGYSALHINLHKLMILYHQTPNLQLQQPSIHCQLLSKDLELKLKFIMKEITWTRRMRNRTE